MSTNPNTAYEKLAQDIYKTLHAAEGINTIDVQHNVKIEGKSGCKHQIDVYWEFEMVGEVHRVAIECKNYSNEVSVGKIRDYFGVLHDIGNIKGIFLTKVGYQSGAKKFADYYGISLKELRFPTDKDWEGRVKDIIIDMSLFTTEVTKRDIELDINWILKNTSIKEGEQLSFGRNTDEIIIYELDSKEIIATFHDLENKLPHSWNEERNLEKTYSFEGAYILGPNNEKLKINMINYVYDVMSATEQTIVEGEEIAKAILKDVNSGKINFFDEQGNVK